MGSFEKEHAGNVIVVIKGGCFLCEGEVVGSGERAEIVCMLHRGGRSICRTWSVFFRILVNSFVSAVCDNAW